MKVSLKEGRVSECILDGGVFSADIVWVLSAVLDCGTRVAGPRKDSVCPPHIARH